MCCPLRDVLRRKSDVPAIVLSLLPDVTGSYSKLFFNQILHHPSESVGRLFILLVFIGMSASELLSNVAMSGGGGGGWPSNV